MCQVLVDIPRECENPELRILCVRCWLMYLENVKILRLRSSCDAGLALPWDPGHCALMSGHVAPHMGPDHYCNCGQLPRGLHFNTRRGNTEFGVICSHKLRRLKPAMQTRGAGFALQYYHSMCRLAGLICSLTLHLGGK